MCCVQLEDGDLLSVLRNRMNSWPAKGVGILEMPERWKVLISSIMMKPEAFRFFVWDEDRNIM